MKKAHFDILHTKVYIAFRTEDLYIFDIEIYKSKLRLFFNIYKEMLNDPNGKTRDITNIGTHGNGKCDISVSSIRQMKRFLM